MINTDRVVPIQKIDLLSMYGLILLQNSDNSSLAKLAADTVEGDFSCSTASALVICDQPLKSLNFGSSITAATVYFVADYAYTGFTKTSATLTVTNPEGGVKADGITLYKAVLSTNALTITQVGF